VDLEEDMNNGLGFQEAKRDLKAVYGHSDSESSDNERRKTLYVMFEGSLGITSRRIVKTLRREVATAAPTQKMAPHDKWMETLISFDSSNYPMNMAGAGQLPLLISPTITNIKLYHVLVDGGAALNLINLAAFKRLQILMSKLQPSCPFSGVAPLPVIPCSCIFLPITFGTPQNFRMESILFYVAEVSLPFNGYLVLKIHPPMVSSRSVEIAMQAPLYLRSSRLWPHSTRLQPSMRAKTRQVRAHASVARHQHPACSPLATKMSP
jgi:hypothetical protein